MPTKFFSLFCCSDSSMSRNVLLSPPAGSRTPHRPTLFESGPVPVTGHYGGEWAGFRASPRPPARVVYCEGCETSDQSSSSGGTGRRRGGTVPGWCSSWCTPRRIGGCTSGGGPPLSHQWSFLPILPDYAETADFCRRNAGDSKSVAQEEEIRFQLLQMSAADVRTSDNREPLAPAHLLQS